MPNVRIALANGTEIQVEAVATRETTNVAFGDRLWKFDSIRSALEGISTEVMDAMRAAKPTSAKIEFGIKVGFEPGKLTALLVQGSGEANLTVTLEWSELKAV